MRERGFDVLTVVNLDLVGADDQEIVETAHERDLTILTLDLDFGQIFVERDPEVRILVLRPETAVPSNISETLDRFLSEVKFESSEFDEALIVVGKTGFRVRRSGDGG